MLKFVNGTHTVEMDRTAIEAAAQAQLLGRLEQSKELAPLLRTALKSTADMLLSFAGIKAPKGADKLEYLTAYILKLGLDKLEEKPLTVSFKVSEEHDPS